MPTIRLLHEIDRLQKRKKKKKKKMKKKKKKKSNFISSDFILVLICHIWMYTLTKNAKIKTHLCCNLFWVKVKYR